MFTLAFFFWPWSPPPPPPPFRAPTPAQGPHLPHSQTPPLSLYRPSTGSTWELDRQTAAKLQQLIPSLDNNQLQGPVGSAIAAVISSDPKLRQALLQGACFFALAAGKAGKAGKAGHGGSEVAQMHIPQQQSQLKSQETQADDVVAVVETSMQNVVEEVRCYAEQCSRQPNGPALSMHAHHCQ